MCPQSKGLGRKQELMDLKLFKNIIDQISVNKPTIKLFMSGEPLLNRDIIEMIEYAHAKGCKTIMHTNATLLREDLAKKILSSHLDRISFSFDGASKEVYEKLRVRSNYDLVKANIKRFLELRKAMGVERPVTAIEIIRMTETDKHIANFVKEWKESGVDEVSVTPCMTWTGEIADLRVEKPKNYGYKPCRSLWQNCAILSDGTVVPCCLDLSGKLPLGNVKEHPFKDIWYGENYNRLRTQHLNRTIPKDSICHGCYNTQISTRRDQAAVTFIRATGQFRRLQKIATKNKISHKDIRTA
jgi:radical SAM protein with 4Fe4S-binding SPASM domain